MLRPTLSPSPRVAVLGDSVTKQWFLQLLGILEPCIVTRDFADDRPRPLGSEAQYAEVHGL